MATNTTSRKARLKNWLLKSGDFLEWSRRYLRPFGFVLFLVVAGLAIEYLFVTIASVYALATLVGAQTIQLVTGAVSATSALVSASLAFFVFRNSQRGAEITLALEDSLDVKTDYRIRKNDQEIVEELSLKLPVVWLNVGPRAGGIIDVKLMLVKPSSPISTKTDGEDFEDDIWIGWSMEITMLKGQNPEFQSPIFSDELRNPVSIGNNESIALTMRIALFLQERLLTRRPGKNWQEILKNTSDFEFKIQWKTATKGGLKPNERSFKIRPKFGEPIQGPPWSPRHGRQV